MKIFKPIIKLFKFIYSLIDKYIVVPISRLVYRINELSRNNSGKIEYIQIYIYLNMYLYICIIIHLYKTMSKLDLSALIGKAKETNMTSPVQKVVPVKNKIRETPFNVHFPDDVLKSLKMLSVEKGTTMKNLIVTAVQEKYFNK